MTSVNIMGEVKFIHNQGEVINTLKSVDKTSKSDVIPPAIKLISGEFVVVEIIISRMQFTNFSDDSGQLTEYIYDL